MRIARVLAIVGVLASRLARSRRQIGCGERADAREHRSVLTQLTLLAEYATDAVLSLDVDGVCIFASPSARDILGYAPEALVGRNVLTRVHPADRRQAFEYYREIATGKAKRCVMTARTKRSDAPVDWMWSEISLGVIRNAADRKPLEIIASARDVTPRKELEIQLDKARERAEAAVKVKSSFLANMSHELRTPMNGVIGFTELLLAGDLTSEQRHQAQLIADSGRAMMRLLNDILDLSRMEVGQMSVCSETFDLSHALRNCLQLLTPVVSQKGLTLECELSPDLPALVDGDGLRVRQIVLNLLGNAAKYTLEGSITLRARPGIGVWGQVVIEVEDTGIGIEKDRQPDMFLPFVQADNRTASRFGGSGLGLAISHQLARLMGGRLELQSEPGRGSLFSLVLPLKAVPDRRAERRIDPVSVYEAPTSDRPLRTLVAEDHDVNQLLITAMLKELGCAVDVANNGAEALAMVTEAANENEPYAAVLMDMRMPEMDGLEATRRIRAGGFRAESLPIVALTANAYADDVAACLESGMQGHLAKPIKLAELRLALTRWTNLRPLPEAPIQRYRLNPMIRDRYRARKTEMVQRLEELVSLGRFDKPVLTEIMEMLHKLAGTAQMFGEGKLGDEVRLLEASIAKASRAERAVHVSKALEAIRATG